MTPNKEDYLKCIYELGQAGGRLTNKLVAEKMNFSAPAVSEMMKKLVAEELITKDKDSGYILKERGQTMVADLYRKHRLIEVFLVNKLHYSAEEVHEEAEILEHTVSERFIDRLEQLLDFPQTCPHGGAIPAKGAELIECYQNTLDTIQDLGHYQLVRVQDNYALLHYLEQHHLAIGDQFYISHIDPFSQTVTLTFAEQTLTLSLAVAQQLYVEKI